jgi:hypothetical protein
VGVDDRVQLFSCFETDSDVCRVAGYSAATDYFEDTLRSFASWMAPGIAEVGTLRRDNYWGKF